MQSHLPPEPTTDSATDPADSFARDISEALTRRIREEIAQSAGQLPFDRFMELALYAPGLGYYAAGAPKFGPSGDFVTAPEISPLFGQCLAAQCAEGLERLGGGDLLEFGAGSGALAGQILGALAERGQLPAHYYILEPSPDLQERQRQHLQHLLPPSTHERCEWLTSLPQHLHAVVIANEVLDAMPVHRFSIMEDDRIGEIFVTNAGEDLCEISAPARSPGLAEAVAGIQADGLARAPGYSSEINLRLDPWLRALFTTLERGLVLLVDYGYPRREYYQPDRSMGTLMCHHRHQAHTDPYRWIGLQDITAHVDFTAVAEAATSAGFTLSGFTTQANFLIGCGIDHLLARSPEALEMIAGAKQLLLPSGMGERFQVMLLEKEVTGHWCGLNARDLCSRL